MKKTVIMITLSILLLNGCENNFEAERLSSSEPSSAPTSSPVPPSTAPTTQPSVAPPTQELLARAATPLLDKSKNRLNNIYIAAEAISGTILKPGETFSFNESVGKRTDAKGYKQAPVIVEGEKEMDHGGGVCQLSTTIYQSANKAKLDIKERHDHQKNVGYAKKGQDAAVNYGTLDFKFINNTSDNIKIVIILNKNEVIAEIYKLF